MDQILGIFVNFLVFVSNRTDCPQIQFIKYNYEYEVPEGLNVFRDWNKDDYFVLDNGFGDSVTVGFLNDDSFEEDLNWYKKNEYWTVLEEYQLEDDAYKIIFDNPDLYDHFDEIIYVKNPKGFVTLTMDNQGDPSKHGAFEENALKLARSVVQGDPDETRKNRDCDHPSLWDLLPRR